MTGLEKAGAWIGVVVFLFGAGSAWTSLNDRIERVDEKIEAIQKTLGSTTCNAILTRQMTAIEKNAAEARKALDTLSERYGCAAQQTGDFNAATTVDAGNSVMIERPRPSEREFREEMRRIDRSMARVH